MQISRVVKEWAAHVAPLLDADAWEGVRDGEASESFYRVNGKYPVRADFLEMFAALLAHRNDVALELGGYDRGCLTGEILCGLRPVFDKVRSLSLATRKRDGGSWVYERTDFGREVARVLGGGQ